MVTLFMVPISVFPSTLFTKDEDFSLEGFFYIRGFLRLRSRQLFKINPSLYIKNQARDFSWSRWGFFKAQNQDVFAEIFTLIKWFFIFCNFYTPMALFIFTFTKLFFATLFKSRKIKIHKINLKKKPQPLKICRQAFFSISKFNHHFKIQCFEDHE